MKIKCPKGLLALSLLTLLSSLASFRYVFSGGQIFVAGILLEGMAFKIYYSVIASTGVACSVGIFLLKRWAFILFLIENIIWELISILNILVVTRSDLLMAGWKDSDDLLSGYRGLMIIAMFIGLIYIVWALSYKNYFRKKNCINSPL